MKKYYAEKILITIVLFVYIFFMFYLGVSPVAVITEIPGTRIIPSYLKHILGSSGLVILFNLWAKTYEIKNYKLYSIIVSFIIGLVIELIQAQIPYRHFSWLDIIYNSVGIFMGLKIIWPLYIKMEYRFFSNFWFIYSFFPF